MSSRIALPLIALLLLAIASWVILDSGSSSPDSNNRSQGQGDQTELEETPPLTGGGLSSSNNSADQLERTDIDLVDSGDDHNLDLSNLDFIPSFTGRVVDEEGNPVMPGEYHIKVEAVDELEEAVSVTTESFGTVTGVSFDKGYAELLVGDIRVRPGDVLEINPKTVKTTIMNKKMRIYALQQGVI